MDPFYSAIDNGADALVGGDAQDTLVGHGGEDTLTGGTGDDSLDGGAGFDQARFSAALNDVTVTKDGDVYTIVSAEGTDTVRNVEEFVFSDITFSAAQMDALAETGNQRLDRRSYGGDDTLIGGTGDDSFYGGTGFDQARFSVASGDVTVTRDGDVYTIVSAEGSDTVRNVEEFVFSDTTLSVAQMDALANAGRVLVGSDGADTLVGPGGDDTLIGGTGDDSLDGGAGFDQARFSVASSEITVLKNGRDGDVYTIVSAEGTDTVRNVEEFVFSDTTLSVTQLDARAGLKLAGGPGNDRIYSGNGWESGNRNDSIDSGSGHDTIWTFGGEDTINAGNGNNDITSGSGHDSITSGDGNDTIRSGSGNDTINAGDGNNRIWSWTGDDTIKTGDGHDWIDAGDEGIVGSTDDDSVESGNGNDTINAGRGNDTIDSGDGHDSIDGGADIDQVRFNVASGDVTVTKDGDVYTIVSAVGTDTVRNVEEFVFSDTTLTATQMDALVGIKLVGGKGADRLVGRGGNDTLIGDGGNDWLDGGAGFDQARFNVASGDVTVIKNPFSNFYTIVSTEGTDTVRNVEEFVFSDTTLSVTQLDARAGIRMVGSAGDDYLIGNYGNDRIYFYDIDSGDGNDTINADDDRNLIWSYGGNDEIHTGDGKDTIWSGKGDDTIHAGDGNNRIHAGDDNDSINSGDGNDRINSGDGHDTINSGDGHDTIYSGWGNDFISSGDRNDLIVADRGNDTIISGDGDDSIDGGAGFDQARFGVASSEFTVMKDGEVYTIVSAEGTDTVRNVEEFVFSDMTLSVTQLDARAGIRMVGSAGDDYLIADYGNDRIYSYDINSGDGNDLIVSRSGDDTIDSGNDNNRIFSQNGDDSIDSGNGNDTINSGFGHDTINSGDGHDLIYSGAENDSINAGGGNDTISSGFGDDTIWSGSGNDQIFGGAGADTFVFNSGHDSDGIKDFELGIDTLRLSGALTGGKSAADIVSDYATIKNGDVVFDFGGEDIITISNLDSLTGLAENIDIF